MGIGDEHRKVVVIGLPYVGKTTFLAALWDVVGSGEVAGTLQLDRLEGDKHYLNEIRNRWADWQKLERTTIPDETRVSMWLKDLGSGRVSEVVFTDMSGESFEQQWNERLCTLEYRQLIDQTAGALLFIHPRRVQDAILIRDAALIVRQLPTAPPVAEPMAADTPEATVAPAKALPTEPRYASTQVQLVELLQFVMGLRPSEHDRLRLGVIISAWDIIDKMMTNASPASWLRERVPLLDQFLRANPESFDFDIFGVSAQGGELSEASELRRKSHQPSDRIIVVHGTERSHDITMPVRWVLRLDSLG